MNLLEQQCSAAILGPRPSPPERAPGQGVTRFAPACTRSWNRWEEPTGHLGAPAPTGLSAPPAEGRSERARKPQHGADHGDAAGTGSGGGQVARRKPTDPAGSPPDPGPPSGWPDLIAFVAVLATGTLLVLFGHVATGGLTTTCLALSGLFAAWWRFRRPRRR